MDNKAIKKLKQKLEKEQLSLKKELETFAREDKKIKYNWDVRYPSREDGNLEEADEVQDYDNLISLEYELETRLKDVSLALKKIDGKKYGKCENCKKSIEEKRLLACPEARLCIKCNR